MRIFLLQFVCVFACRPGPGGYEQPKPIQNTTTNVSQWDAWIPKEDEKSKKEWIEMYKNLTTQADHWDEFKANNPGLPGDWAAYGHGSVGAPPPAWAQIPNSYGRPDFCFLFPAQGKCNETLIRWAFNPTTLKCQQFTYSGCGANGNNFKYEASCLRACSVVPSSPCFGGDMDFVDIMGYSAPKEIQDNL